MIGLNVSMKHKEKNMVSTKFCLRILVFVLGMTFVGCMNKGIDGIDGVWISSTEEGVYYTFSDGEFSFSTLSTDGQNVKLSGTYTLEGNKLITTITHINIGNIVDDDYNPEMQKILTGIKNGNEVTFTSEVEGKTEKWTYRKQDSISKGAKPSDFVGKWELEGGNFPFRKAELFKDGTGITDENGFSWKLVDNRLVITHPFFAMACDYKISGAKITLITDDGKSGTFVKRK
jgi:hypothetical protein